MNYSNFGAYAIWRFEKYTEVNCIIVKIDTDYYSVYKKSYGYDPI